MPKNLIGYLCLWILSLSGLAYAQSSQSSPSEKNYLYHSWHDACLQFDMDSIDKHIAKFEAVLSKDPSDHLAQAYLGSAYAIRAKVAFWPLTKLSNLKHGKKLIDSAVNSDPKNPRVRMVRAVAYFRVPKFFECRPTSISDFNLMVPEAMKGTLGLTPKERQGLLYYASLAYADEGHEALAKRCKEKCHSIDPHSKYGELTKP